VNSTAQLDRLAASAKTTLFYGPWHRRSPFFEKTLGAGVTGFDIDNHMYIPAYFAVPVEEYWHLLNHDGDAVLRPRPLHLDRVHLRLVDGSSTPRRRSRWATLDPSGHDGAGHEAAPATKRRRPGRRHRRMTAT